MDLVRMILLRMESNPGAGAPADLGIKSYSPQEIDYHAHIMMQEGLIEGQGGVPTSLTWKGHEFLDLARDSSRWNHAKGVIAKVGGAPISVWMKVLTDLMLHGMEIVGAKGT